MLDHLVTAIAGFVIGTLCDGILALAGWLRRDRRAVWVVLLATVTAALLWRAGFITGWWIPAAAAAAIVCLALLRRRRTPAGPS